MQKNLPPKPKDFTVNREVLRQRQMQALQTRHDAGLTDKVIGKAIWRDPDTIGNWRLGKTEMKIGDLIALDNFFCAMGDFQFIEAVCGELAARRRMKAKQLERQAAALHEQAEWLEAEGAAA